MGGPGTLACGLTVPPYLCSKARPPEPGEVLGDGQGETEGDVQGDVGVECNPGEDHPDVKPENEVGDTDLAENVGEGERARRMSSIEYT